MCIEYTCMYAFYYEIVVLILKRISLHKDVDPRAVLHIRILSIGDATDVVVSMGLFSM